MSLRFQTCAVVSCCSPPSPPPPEIRDAVCRHDHIRATSVGDNITHSHIRRRHHDRCPTRIERRNAASPKPVAALRHRYRHRKSGMPRVVMITEERAKSAAISRVHTSAGAPTIAVQLASKRDIAKALQGQGQQAVFGAMRLLLSNTRASDVIASAAGIK